MPNFLARLVKRTWGMIPTVKPLIMPLFAPPSVKGRNRFFTSRLKRRIVSDELTHGSRVESSEPAVQPRFLDSRVNRSQEPQFLPTEPLDLTSPNNPSSPRVEPTANLTDSLPKQFDQIELTTDLTTNSRSTSQIQSDSLETNRDNSFTNTESSAERIKFQSILKQPNKNQIQRQTEVLPLESQPSRVISSQPIDSHEESSNITQLPLVRSIPEIETHVSSDRDTFLQIDLDQQSLEHSTRFNPVDLDQQPLEHSTRFNPVTNRENITNSINTKLESPSATLTQPIRNRKNQATDQARPFNQSRFYLRTTQPASAAVAEVKPRLEISTESQSDVQDSISSNLAIQTQSQHRRTYEKSTVPIDDEPTVQVTIGRIVVRGITTPPSTPQSQPSKPTESDSRLSLEDYLRQREGGSR